MVESTRDSVKHFNFLKCFNQSPTSSLVKNRLAFLRKSHGGCDSSEDWWAKMDSNHRPHDYQSCALASWAIGPLVEIIGLEPMTPCLQSRCSTNWTIPPLYERVTRLAPSKLNNAVPTLPPEVWPGRYRVSLSCHASPAHNARLPFASDSKQNLAILGSSSSLRSTLAVRYGSVASLKSP